MSQLDTKVFLVPTYNANGKLIIQYPTLSYIKEFDKLSNSDKIILITKLINNTTQITNPDTINKNFKMEFYYQLFRFSIDKIIEIYQSPQISHAEIVNLDNFLLKILLDKLTKSSQGRFLLCRLNQYINKIIKSDNDILPFLYTAATKGTLLTFFFWLDKTKNKKLESINPNTLHQIYINSIGNSDDRLYKFILKHIDNHDKLFFQKNNNVINNFITVLAYSKVPPKYQLRRIKILSQKISLIPYFKHMISTFIHEKVLFEVHNYYYNEPHSYESLNNLIRKIMNTQETNLLVDYPEYNLKWNMPFSKFNKIFSSLKTNEEKISAQIILSLYTYNCYKFKIIDTSIIEKIVIENYLLITKNINWNNLLISLNFVNLNKLVLNILVNNNLITKYLILMPTVYQYNFQILIFTRFLPVFNYSNKTDPTRIIIIMNKVLHKLRLIAKKKSKFKFIQRNVKLFDILNEIKNFAPNNTIPVLANGSNIFQKYKQKFSNLPPRHLLPGELIIYKNFLLREKADGILINNLPIGIYPQTALISKYQVKAEYIEDLDLYLVFDIDIPNTTIIDRYNILRQAHLNTDTTYIENINNLDDMFKIMEKERINIKKFINENQHFTIKWYPKFACVYNHYSDKTIYKQLIQQIDEFSSKLKSSDPYNCDGLILSPINGEREIKIKPKTLMTIDLMFDGKKWVDRNKNDWSYMIINPTQVKKENRIYRCYPQFDIKSVLRFIVGEYRYDKKQPNPYYVIDNIINILNYDWSNDLNDIESYYYNTNKSLKSIKLIQTIQAQNNLLEQKINMLNPSFNKKWLDLGCGRGKLIELIKKYNPQSYLGLDADIKQLVRALNIYDENQNIYQFNPCNLSTNWKTTKNKWFSFDNKIKYDYVIANFSLMHFCTEEFWSQLNEIVHEETKFIFNFVKPTDSTEWYESNSFLKVQDNFVSYKFEWTHTEVKKEPLISEELITNYLNKFNWKVIDSNQIISTHSLLNFYSWWIVQHK
jgi:SAM-dependent methyltransferase/cell fate (sporulation/competence/biofilm development) regulator YmcA (YheA/YmcA/DUF963 family)